MKKITLAPEALLFPMPAVLVGAAAPEGKVNFTTIAWAGVVNSTPPMLGVGIRPSRYTHELIALTGQFSVNIPSSKQVVETDYCGIVSGRNADKVEVCGFTVFYGALKKAPLIEQCPMSIACTVEKVIELPSHDYFVGKIVEIQMDESLKNDREKRNMAVDPLVFMGTHYAGVRGNFGRAFSAGRALKKT